METQYVTQEYLFGVCYPLALDPSIDAHVFILSSYYLPSASIIWSVYKYIIYCKVMRNNILIILNYVKTLCFNYIN